MASRNNGFDDITLDHPNDGKVYMNWSNKKILVKGTPYATIKFSLRKDLGIVFDRWLIEKFDAKDLLKAIAAWHKYLECNKTSNPIIEHLRLCNTPSGFDVYTVVQDYQIMFLTSSQQSNFIDIIINYFKWKIRHPMFKMGRLQSVEAITTAIMDKQIEVVKEIMPLTNKPQVYCRAYVNLEYLDPNKRLFAWNAFLQQFTHSDYADVFCAWVYSCFVGDDRGRQAMCLLGDGRTGKSTVLRVVRAYMNSLGSGLTMSLDSGKHEDKFSMATYIGVRLATYSDCSDRAIMTRETIKQLTGEDPTSIRRMGVAKDEAVLHCKIMITTNFCPWINTDQEHEISRILLCPLDEKKSSIQRNSWDTGSKGVWERALLDEFSAFLAFCKFAYNKLRKVGSDDIQYPKDMIKQLNGMGMNNELGTLDNWWDSNLVEDEKSRVSLDELIYDYARFYGGVKMRVRLQQVLVRKLNKKFKTEDINCNTSMVIHGLKIKDHSLTSKSMVSKKLLSLR